MSVVLMATHVDLPPFLPNSTSMFGLVVQISSWGTGQKQVSRYQSGVYYRSCFSIVCVEGGGIDV